MDRKEEVAIRAEGAELFVRAHLMLHYGVPVSMASRNMPGYDLIAHNPELGRDCRIQVKYRSAINADGARVKHFGFDFLVYVAGNVGRIGSKVALSQAEPRAAEFFVLPKEAVEEGLGSHDLFGSPTRGRREEYRNAWHLILSFLSTPRTAVSSENTDSLLPPVI